MSKLIDADALAYIVASNGDADFINKVTGLMIDAPSIDICFCKECKYYEAKEDWCYWRDEAITADDFCSYGERSGKPNNCELQTIRCPKCGRTDYIRDMEKDMGIKDSHYKYKCINCNFYIKTEPTISKMEQVDKDINVRSKERSE